MNSPKPYVAVFYNLLGTITLLIFGKKLYVAVFYNHFGSIIFPIFDKKLYVAVFYNDFSTFARKMTFILLKIQ